MAAEDSKSIQEVLSLPILLADRAIKSAREAEYFKLESSELARQVTRLAELLRAAARLVSAAAVYDRPIRRVSLEVTKTLERALTLAQKCRRKRTAVLHHVLTITTAADFKKLSALLESSLTDIKWVLSIFNHDSGNGSISLSLPPIASTDPILAWIWTNIAAVHMGRAEAANGLEILAWDNERNKKMIVEENGIPPLLNMLKESGNTDAQAAAAAALCNLADSPARVRKIMEALGVQIVVKALSEVPMRVQVTLVNLVSRMSQADAQVQEEFGRENVTRPLVALLGMDVDLEELKEANSVKAVSSLHSLVAINKEMAGKGIGGGNRKEKDREAESPGIRLMLKASCANALWKLTRKSLENSKKITETKGLFVLGKIIEKESEELRMNCLMVVMELAVVAECNSDLKRGAFKPSLIAARVVLDQLLRVINEETNASLVTPAIMAVGCLASMFSAKEKRIVNSLVTWLGQRNHNIAVEAAKALCKFVCDDNYNCKQHAQAIIEFDGVPKIMNMLRGKDCGHLHELVLLCHLASNAGNSKALEQARALSVLEGAARHTVAQNPALRELFTKAIHHLTIYQAGAHMHHPHP